MTSHVHSPAGAGAANHAFGLTRHIRVTAEETGGAFALFEEEIPEGVGPPLHIHRAEHETFIVTEGAVRFRAGERDFVAEVGDVVVIAPGTPHTFQGARPGTSRALVQIAPGAAAGFFAAVEAEGLDPATDMERIVEIAAAHNRRLRRPADRLSAFPAPRA